MDETIKQQLQQRSLEYQQNALQDYDDLGGKKRIGTSVQAWFSFKRPQFLLFH